MPLSQQVGVSLPNILMKWFKVIAFIGAALLILGIAPSSPSIGLYTRIGGALALMWGGFYFLLRENELLFGIVSVCLAVLVQPFYMIPFSPGLWMTVDIVATVYLVLAGLLCIKFERQREIKHAQVQAELEMYRKNDEKLKQEQARQNHR